MNIRAVAVGLAVIAVAVMLFFVVAEKRRLNVLLSAEAHGNKVLATVTFFNPTDTDIQLEASNSLADGISRNVFEITADGERAAYRGEAKEPMGAKTIPAGGKFSVTVTLNSAYQLDSGMMYRIRYRADNEGREIRSDWVDVEIPGAQD
mgnify:CR=1 FL=1